MRRLNLQIVIEIICFSLFGGLLLYFVVTGQYVNYVNPRLLPFLWITIILIFLWIMNRLRYIKRKTHRIQLTHCFSILLPFILFAVPLGNIKSSTLPNDYVDSSQLKDYIGGSALGTSTSTSYAKVDEPKQSDNPAKSEEQEKPKEEQGASDSLINKDQQSKENPNEGSASSSEDKTENKLSKDERLSAPFIIDGLNEREKTVVVKDEYFLPWLSELSSNLNLYMGYTVTIKGFVFEDGSLMEQDDLSISRMLMSCCTADLTPIGLLSSHRLDRNILVDQWYTFKGVITSKQFLGKTVPYLQINEATRSSKPAVEYIYP